MHKGHEGYGRAATESVVRIDTSAGPKKTSEELRALYGGSDSVLIADAESTSDGATGGADEAMPEETEDSAEITAKKPRLMTRGLSRISRVLKRTAEKVSATADNWAERRTAKEFAEDTLVATVDKSQEAVELAKVAAQHIGEKTLEGAAKVKRGVEIAEGNVRVGYNVAGQVIEQKVTNAKEAVGSSIERAKDFYSQKKAAAEARKQARIEAVQKRAEQREAYKMNVQFDKEARRRNIEANDRAVAEENARHIQQIAEATRDHQARIAQLQSERAVL